MSTVKCNFYEFTKFNKNILFLILTSTFKLIIHFQFLTFLFFCLFSCAVLAVNR